VLWFVNTLRHRLPQALPLPCNCRATSVASFPSGPSPQPRCRCSRPANPRLGLLCQALAVDLASAVSVSSMQLEVGGALSPSVSLRCVSIFGHDARSPYCGSNGIRAARMETSRPGRLYAAGGVAIAWIDPCPARIGFRPAGI
jgi:hypothetical protein